MKKKYWPFKNLRKKHFFLKITIPLPSKITTMKNTKPVSNASHDNEPK